MMTLTLYGGLYRTNHKALLYAVAVGAAKTAVAEGYAPLHHMLEKAGQDSCSIDSDGRLPARRFFSVRVPLGGRYDTSTGPILYVSSED